MTMADWAGRPQESQADVLYLRPSPHVPNWVSNGWSWRPRGVTVYVDADAVGVLVTTSACTSVLSRSVSRLVEIPRSVPASSLNRSGLSQSDLIMSRVQGRPRRATDFSSPRRLGSGGLVTPYPE